MDATRHMPRDRPRTPVQTADSQRSVVLNAGPPRLASATGNVRRSSFPAHCRARESAVVVAAVLGLPEVEPEPLVAEWRAPHCVLGLASDEYPAEYQDWRQHRADDIDSALPGGESLRPFAVRAAEAAMVMAGRAEGRSILVVSHRVLIGAVAALAQGNRQPAVIFASRVGSLCGRLNCGRCLDRNGAGDQPKMPASASRASRFARMKSFNSSGFKSTAASASPWRSISSSS